ncbi:MAG: hypothetical protein FJ137_17310 [Deltaproteobacteria bacterium]|nr:hypothetical protein [Deltaproteobacteria bacterium]
MADAPTSHVVAHQQAPRARGEAACRAGRPAPRRAAMFMVASWWLVVVGSTHGGCARTAASAPMVATTWTVAGGAPVAVRGSRRLSADVAAITRALPAAAARLARAGLRWHTPIEIVLHDDVASFVRATGRTTSTLRAWTTWRTVHLLPRWTWASASEPATVARVAHELCHAALHQRHPDETAALARRAPRFVTEGVCSVLADQGAERMPIASVRARLHEQPDERVDFDADPVFAYGYAHHVFAALAACRGPAALLAAVDDTAEGGRVEAALGAPPADWLRAGCPPPTGGGATDGPPVGPS